MKPQFVRCELCKAEVQTDECSFAVHRTEINGEEHVFCCQQCAKNYKEKKARRDKMKPI